MKTFFEHGDDLMTACGKYLDELCPAPTETWSGGPFCIRIGQRDVIFCQFGHSEHTRKLALALFLGNKELGARYEHYWFWKSRGKFGIFAPHASPGAAMFHAFETLTEPA